MNKKVFLILVALIILVSGFYIFHNYSKTEKPKPFIAETPVQNAENITVELSLKTPDSATQSAVVVNLPVGSDHCEVLKKALEEGKIKDLDMRYQEKYQTYGVYVINSIGKTDSPWWVYKINGSDAPLGCSQIKVASGDKILWEYIGE